MAEINGVRQAPATVQKDIQWVAQRPQVQAWVDKTIGQILTAQKSPKTSQQMSGQTYAAHMEEQKAQIPKKIEALKEIKYRDDFKTAGYKLYKETKHIATTEQRKEIGRLAESGSPYYEKQFNANPWDTYNSIQKKRGR